jgi:hypothetical protein
MDDRAKSLRNGTMTLSDYRRMRGPYPEEPDPLDSILWTPDQIAFLYVEQALNQNPYEFKYVDITSFLSARDEDGTAWRRCTNMLAARPHENDTPDAHDFTQFTPQEILQICLLQTLPFCWYDPRLQKSRITRPEKVRDLRVEDRWRYDSARQAWGLPEGIEDDWHHCPSRPQFVAIHAARLYYYECRRRIAEDNWKVQQGMERGVRQCYQVVEEHIRLIMRDRRTRKRKTEKSLPYKTATLNKMLASLEQTRTIPSGADYPRMYFSSPEAAQDSLIAEMNACWRRGGPQHYPADATFHALAAILMAFGLEHPRCPEDDKVRKTVADRIASRLAASRHRKGTRRRKGGRAPRD